MSTRLKKAPVQPFANPKDVVESFKRPILGPPRPGPTVEAAEGTAPEPALKPLATAPAPEPVASATVRSPALPPVQPVAPIPPVVDTDGIEANRLANEQAEQFQFATEPVKELTEQEQLEFGSILGRSGEDSLTLQDGTVIRRSQIDSKFLPIDRPVLSGIVETDPFEPKTEDEIRKEEMKRAQELINATQGLFTENLFDIAKAGEGALSQRQSISTGQGLAGSEFAQAQAQKVQAQTARVERAERARRSAEVAGIMASAQGRADDRFDKEVARYERERDFAVDERDREIEESKIKARENRTKAVDTIKGFASGGISLSEMNESDFEKLLADGNMTDFEAHALWASNTPESGAKMTISGGNIISSYFDPVSQKPVVSVEALPPEVVQAIEEGAPDVAIKTITTDEGIFSYDSKSSNPVFTRVGGAPEKAETEGERFRREDRLAEAKSALATTETAAGLIDKMIADTSGLDKATGRVQGIMGVDNVLLSGDGKVFAQNFDTLKGLLTLENMGKMSGILSDSDIKILQNASLPLSRTFEAQDFLKALNEIKTVLGKAVLDQSLSIAPEQDSELDFDALLDEVDFGNLADLDSLIDEASGKANGGTETTTNKLSVVLPDGTRHEGGTASWRNNNPLNIKYGSFAQNYDTVQGSAATDGGNFAAFSSPEEGLRAARDLLKAPGYTSRDLETAMRRWSGGLNSDGSFNGRGYGADVAPAHLRNKRTGEMTDSELTELINSMKRREGWRTGSSFA